MKIDLHLHPKWQRSLIPHLSELFPQTQFIVTAHSPLIVQAAPDANIVLLKREGGHVKIHNQKQDDIIREWSLDQLLTSELYDLISTRPPEYDPILIRREEILSKDKLTKEDEIELAEIGKKLENLPVTNNPADQQAWELIRRAAESLKGES